ncbi:MAG TPA: hypothetical protein VN540_08985 [Clostridia bacterium]|nr:hypothetical protein [Clostridia bacterium]
MRKLNPAKLITIGAMCTALSVLSLYASSTLPTLKLAFYFLSSVFVYMLAEQEAYGAAVLSFAATGLLGFLILPDKLYLIPYVGLLGHYGIFRTWFDKRTEDKLLRFFLCMLYCNIVAALGLVASIYVLYVDVKALLGALPVPPWLLIPALEVGFALFDLLYWLCQKIYVERVKNHIIPKR